MQSMRDLLRRDLGRSLEKHPAMDRIAVAWPVACGRAMAAQGRPVSMEDGVLLVEVRAEPWMEEFRVRGAVLQHELARIARVPLQGIHFRKALAGW